MFCHRTFYVAATVAVSAVLFSSSSVFADHLDHRQSQVVVRHVEEQGDALHDTVDSWINDRADERFHQAVDVVQNMEKFEKAVLDLRTPMFSHEEPWDLRDQAKAVVDAAGELHGSIDRAHFLPKDIAHNWESLRGQVDELATLYHLDPCR